MVTFQSLCSKTRASHPRQSKNWRKWCPVWTKIFLHFSWGSSPFNAMTSKWTFSSNGRWSVSLICYLYAQKAGNKRPCFVFWLSNMCSIHSWFSFVGRALQYLCPPSSPSPSETEHFQPILRAPFAHVAVLHKGECVYWEEYAWGCSLVVALFFTILLHRFTRSA